MFPSKQKFSPLGGDGWATIVRPEPAGPPAGDEANVDIHLLLERRLRQAPNGFSPLQPTRHPRQACDQGKALSLTKSASSRRLVSDMVIVADTSRDLPLRPALLIAVTWKESFVPLLGPGSLKAVLALPILIGVFPAPSLVVE